MKEQRSTAKSRVPGQPWQLFLTIMGGGIAITLIALIVNPERAAGSLFFNSLSNTHMDFYNSLKSADDLNLYINYKNIYPPLCNFFYHLLGRLIPNIGALSAEEIRETTRGIVLCWSMNIAGAGLLWLGVYLNAGGLERKRRILLAALALFSLPMLYAMERGNSVVMTVDLVLISLYCMEKGMEEGRDGLKETGLILLAVAANIKLWPAAFGLLLVRNGKWYDALHCILYGVLLFYLPMMFFETGFRTAALMIENVEFTGGIMAASGLGYKISWSNFAEILSRVIHVHIDGNVFSGFFLLLTAAGMMLCRRKSGFLTGAALICCGFPAFSFNYNGLYLLIPLCAMLSETGEEKSRYEAVMTVLLTLAIVPLGTGGRHPFPAFTANDFGDLKSFNISTLVSCVSLTAVSVVFAFHTFLNERNHFRSIFHLKMD